MSTSRFTRLAAVAVAGAFPLVLSACTEASPSNSAAAPSSNCTPATSGLQTISQGFLTVGVPDNPPFTQNATDGSASGLEIDVLKKLAEKECLGLRYVQITYGNGIPMITEQRRVDLISGGWYVTEARNKQVGFTSPTYYDAMAIISKEGWDTVTQLEQAGQVGSGSGFSWQDDMTKVLGSKMRNYPGTTEMKQDLLAGRLQAALDGYGVAVFAYKGTDFKVEMAKQDPRIAITKDKPISAFPMDKQNRALNDALSKQIDAMRADGTLASILKTHELDEALVVPADRAKTALRY